MSDISKLKSEKDPEYWKEEREDLKSFRIQKIIDLLCKQDKAKKKMESLKTATARDKQQKIITSLERKINSYPYDEVDKAMRYLYMKGTSRGCK